MRNLFDKINCPLQRIPRDDLLRARKNPELIAPMQATTARQYQWVAPGFDGFVSQGARLVGTCVLAGISYWDVDRPEIDEVLDALLPGTEVVVAYPRPPPELLAALQARSFDPVECAGPPL
jgi:hypothetical protein